MLICVLIKFVCVREVSTGHSGNGRELQLFESRENSNLGKYVFYGSGTFHSRISSVNVSYVGRRMFTFPNM